MIEIIVIAITLAIDFFTKHWAETILQHMPNKTMPIIKDVLHLTYVENRGSAFGLFQNKKVFLLIFASIAIVIIAAFFISKRNQMGLWARVAFSLMISGALGNVIDRFMLGYVRDMVDFRGIGFAVFNFADVCLTISVVMLLIYLFFFEEGKAFLNEGDETKK